MHFLHSGSSLVNLILTGRVNDGWPLGRISNIVGDKSSGKTLFAIEAAALFLQTPPEGITPKVFYYEAESAFDMDYAERIGLPINKVKFIDVEDRTVEHVFAVLEKICDTSKKGEGSLFILDSLDAITSEKELEKEFDNDKTYAMSKQKKFGELFNKLVNKLEKANVHLMIISQIRENITTLPFAPKYRRSGGKSLDFYASHIVWLAETEKLKTSTKMIYGANCHVKVTKNKVGKNYRECNVPIIYNFGLDEIYSLLKFLTTDLVPKEFRIKEERKTLTWKGIEAKIHEFVAAIEEDLDLYTDLVNQVQQAWDAIEEEATVYRKNKADLILQNQKNKAKPAPVISFTRRNVLTDTVEKEDQKEV